MIAFADTSFLCSLLREQATTRAAETLLAELGGPVTISTLLAFEFRQSARLQNFRFASDRSQGWPAAETAALLARFDENIARGAFVFGEVAWPDVHSLAERLSAAHVAREGQRSLDVLHVATALHLRADAFLTFDAPQARLAAHAGLHVRPAPA